MPIHNFDRYQTIVGHAIQNMATAYVIVIVPLMLLPYPFLRLLLVYLRLLLRLQRIWCRENIHNLQYGEKEMHLLLPATEIHTFKLLKLAE